MKFTGYTPLHVSIICLQFQAGDICRFLTNEFYRLPRLSQLTSYNYWQHCVSKRRKSGATTSSAVQLHKVTIKCTAFPTFCYLSVWISVHCKPVCDWWQVVLHCGCPRSSIITWTFTKHSEVTITLRIDIIVFQQAVPAHFTETVLILYRLTRVHAWTLR